jgi:hypothetical protein
VVYVRPKAGLKQPPLIDPAVLIIANNVNAIAAAYNIPSLLS